MVGGLIVFLYGHLWWHHLRLLPSHEAPPGAPRAQAVPADALRWWPGEFDAAMLQQHLAEQPLLALTLSLLSLWALGFGVGGIVLTLWGLVSGKIRAVWRFTSARLPAWSLGELGRILLILLLLAVALPLMLLTLASYGGDLVGDAHLRMTVSMLVLDGAAIGLILAFAALKGSSVRTAFGWSGRTFPQAFLVGLRGYVALFPWLFLILMAAVEAVRVLGIKIPIEPLQQLLFEEDRPLVLGLTIALVCVLGPVAEELFFRGVVYTALRQRLSWVWATAASAAVFALLHTNLVGFASIFLLGCFLANLYERTGSLVGTIAIHVLHNTFLMGLALAVRQLMTQGS